MRRQIDNSLLEMALVGYSAKRDDIVRKMAEIRLHLGGPTSAQATKPTGDAKPRRKMSAAGRARIAEAQRKRWAASKKAAEPWKRLPSLSGSSRRLAEERSLPPRRSGGRR